MKNTFIIILATLLFAACNNKEKIADANGNFQSDATTVSAESMGKLILFNVTEGETIEKDSIVGIIDTTQLELKKEQLQASIISIESQSKSVLSQINVLKEQLKVQKNNRNRI